MSKNLAFACLLAGTLAAAGCQASLNANVTPGTPGASASPGATTGTTVDANVGGSTTPVAGNAAGAVATFYKLGRKWTYETTVDTAGQKVVIPYTREVTKVEGGKAWVKTVTTFNGKATETTDEVDLSKQLDPTAWFTKSTAADGTTSEHTWQQSSVGADQLTVKAGSFSAQKYVGKLTAKSANGAASAAGAQDATFWTNDTEGLLKSETKGSQTTEAMGQSFTVNFTSTTELVSITK